MGWCWTILEASHKMPNLISLIWIDKCYHQLRECAAKILLHHYALVVSLLIVHLARISLDKIPTILLGSVKFEKGGIFVFNVSYSCNTFKFGLSLN